MKMRNVMQSVLVIFSGLSFLHLILTCGIEIPFLLINRKKIKSSVSTCSCCDIGLVPSFFINLCMAFYIAKFIVDNLDKNSMVLDGLLATLPITITISLMSEVRVFTYYRDTNTIAILIVALLNVVIYCIANTCVILTYKYNPNFHDSKL